MYYYAECYAEYRYAASRYAECQGAIITHTGIVGNMLVENMPVGKKSWRSKLRIFLKR